mgnify:CR=1 FL=1
MQRLRILVILILLSLMPLYSLAVLNEGQYAFRSLDINNGLSQNTVHAILQDKQGFMWFGTKDGLDRYDGISFRTFMKESGTLGNNFITSLYEDNLGQIWIGTDVGLYVYCPQMEKVRHFTLISNSNIDIDCTVNLITGDQKGGIWVVTQTRGIFYYNPQDSQLVNYQSDGSGTLNLKTSGQLYFDSDDVCWLDIRDGNLYYSKDKLKTLTPIFPEDSKVSFRDEYIYKLLPGPYNCMYVGTVFGLKEVNLTNKTIRTLLSKDELGGDIYIRELAFYSDDELWIGTESGLYIYNLHTAKIIHLQNVNGDPYSISDNAIYSILKDREGGMWIGTYFGGVNYYPRQYTYFDKVYPQKESNKMGKRVREFCAAHDGTLWIGTEDKGLFHYYPSTGKIEPFIHPDIYHNVHGLYLDGDYLWVGNFAKGLKRIDLRTYAVKHYDNIASDIFSICRITAGDLYLGTTIGLFRYNPDTERFKRVPELGWTFVYYIKEDKQGNLWLATYADGVYKKNVRTGGWEHFVHEEADSSTLPSNKVLSIFEDSQNQLWFTTQGGGFCRFVPSANTFVRYDGIGLPSNVIYRIEEDEKGVFWVSTNKGLVHFNPKNSSFKVYTVANGLLSNQFNYQSSYKDKNGRIYFGCINGFISFAPSSFIDNDFLPSVLITDFMLFNKKVVVGEKGSPLKQSITLSNHIELQSNQNSFSFRIAAISYQSPSMNTLLYRLEGYDSEWHTAGKGPITYSNLPYGTYMLRVKGANSDGVWNPDVRTLGIRILPPFYLSVWAYLIYILLILGTFFALFFYLRKRTIEKQRKEMEKFEQEKEQELYTTKIDFFTNVAHEIRTPLTLIKCPLENVLADRELSENVRMELEIMDQNVERLLNLINQLLDFRKTESQGFRLNFAKCNVTEVLKETHVRFTSLAKQKGLEFTLQVPEKDFYAHVNREAFTKIISNLLNNGVKYAESYVHISLEVPEADDNNSFRIRTENDGVIIPNEMKEEIFKPFVRFNEKEDGKVTTGTGIGLALSRSLAELHQGTLAMGAGEENNTFCLTLPIVQDMTITLTPEPEAGIDKMSEIPAGEAEKKDNRPTVLVVEDNPDMLAFVVRQLSKEYAVLTATNGEEALQVLDGNYVNLVVSDVVMPVMDGFELCKTIKSDLNYSHIPVILLTAKTNIQSKIEGMELGADAYLEKPFSVEYLQACASSLIQNREKLRKAFAQSPFVAANTMALTKADEDFIKKLNEVIQVNYSNPEFSMDDMADSLNMSRSNFYRKIKGVLDLSPNEYLRLERLKKAAQLLKEGENRVNEICYMVGFNSPSYFAKCFQKQFGVLPKDFVS